MDHTTFSSSSRGTTPSFEDDHPDSIHDDFTIAELSVQFNQHTLGSPHPSGHLEVPPLRTESSRLSALVRQTAPPHNYQTWERKQSTASRRGLPAISSRLSAIVDNILHDDHSNYHAPHHSSLSHYYSNSTSSDDIELPPISSSPVIDSWPSLGNSQLPPSESSTTSDDSDLRYTMNSKMQSPYNNSQKPRPAVFSDGQRGRYVVEKNIKMRRRRMRKASWCGK